MRTAVALAVCLAPLIATRAEEPKHEAALKAYARTMDAALKSGDKAAIRKATVAALPTKADVKALFPDAHEQLWPHVRQLNEETLKEIETLTPEDLAKMRDEGKLLAVTLRDIRKEEAGRRTPKKYIRAVPTSIPIYSYETEAENESSGTFPFFWVGGRWVSLMHIPGRLAEFVKSSHPPERPRGK